MSSDYAYETNCPQWVDLEAMTPSHDNHPADDFFNYSHDSLEATPVRQNQRTKKLLRSQQIKTSSTCETPKTNRLTDSKLQSTFLNDIDNICITPLKLISPGTKHNEHVLKEISVNEVLTEALDGLKLTASLKKRPKQQEFNKTVCPTIKIIADTPTRRKVRISQSMTGAVLNNQNEAQDHQASADMTVNTRRSARIKNSKTSEITKTASKAKIELANEKKDKDLKTPLKVEKHETQLLDDKEKEVTKKLTISKILNDEADKISENVKENIENENSSLSNAKKNNRASVCTSDLKESETVKRKIRLSRSMHPSTPTGRTPVYNLQTSPCTMNLKPSNIPVYKLNDELNRSQPIHEQMNQVNKIDMVNSNGLQKLSVNLEIEEDNYNEDALPDFNEVRENQEINMPDIEQQVLDDNNEVDEEARDDFQPFDVFSKSLDDDQELFKVHQTARNVNRPRALNKMAVLAGQARRNSIKMNTIVNKNRPNKYISLAEGVKAFQRSTPTRFHTVSKKIDGRPKLAVVSQKLQVPKSTVPVSPTWHSKPRVRNNRQLDNDKQKDLNTKNKKSIAHPVPKNILTAPKPLKEIPKKPVTVPKPFKLSQPKKNTKFAAPTTTVDPAIPTTTNNIISKISNKVLTADAKVHVADNINASCIGIPFTKDINASCKVESKKCTVRPSCVEARTKKLLNSKTDNINKLQEIKKKTKGESHVKQSTSSVKNLDSNARKGNVMDKKEKLQKVRSDMKVMPFSFDGRDKLIAQRKEEMRKKMKEEEKIVHVFHANPVPNFKPVTVKVTSRENIRSDLNKSKKDNLLLNRTQVRARSAESLKTRTTGENPQISARKTVRGLSADNFKRPQLNNSRQNIKNSHNKCLNVKSSVTESLASLSTEQKHSNDDQKTLNVPPMKQKLMPTTLELHSDKRARLRREYDEKLKHRSEQEAERRRILEEQRSAQEQAEIKELRRKAEHKAQPVPVYKPLRIVKSTKPVTDPQSPAWTRR